MIKPVNWSRPRHHKLVDLGRRIIFSCAVCLVGAVAVAGCTGKSQPSDVDAGASAQRTGGGLSGAENISTAAADQTNAPSEQESTLTSPGSMPLVPLESPSAANAPKIPLIMDQTDLIQRNFFTLEPIDSSDPETLLVHLSKVDEAFADLMRAGASKRVDEATFNERGLALARMKRDDGRRITESANVTPENRKAGLLAQLESLSHMTGLRDVDAAKELEQFATEQKSSADADVAHQSRVVLMGFQLQALQNGIVQDAKTIVDQAAALFDRPEDRNYPELMILQHAGQVMSQMGYEEESQQMDQILIEQFSQALDPRLRATAWGTQVQSSQAWENYANSIRAVEPNNSSSWTDFLAAARGLFDEFPNRGTLEQLSGSVTDIEYGGAPELAHQLVALISEQLPTLDSPDASEDIHAILENHESRYALKGKPLQIEGLIGFDGKPMNWDDYNQKVVLVDFWATWCGPCLQEIPGIRRIYDELSGTGFEVISVNMDNNLNAAQEFLQKQRFPWRTFHPQDTQLLGFESTFARELGISAIPFMVLVGKDGNVAAIHVRGEQLGPTVRSLLDEGSLIVN